MRGKRITLSEHEAQTIANALVGRMAYLNRVEMQGEQTEREKAIITALRRRCKNIWPQIHTW